MESTVNDKHTVIKKSMNATEAKHSLSFIMIIILTDIATKSLWGGLKVMKLFFLLRSDKQHFLRTLKFNMKVVCVQC